MAIIRGILLFLSVLSLGGSIAAGLYWRKGIKNEDEEQVMYGKRATIIGVLAFLVCGGILVGLWLRTSAPKPVTPVSLAPSTHAPLSLEGRGQGEGDFLNPNTPPTLATGPIDYHYPARAQEQVPLNTLVVVHTAQDVATFTEGDIVVKAKSGSDAVLLDRVALAGDAATMAFKPHEGLKPLTSYHVSLKDYSWDFTTGTTEDATPPEVVSLQPQSKDPLPRNSIVEFNFSEPVLLTTSDAVQVRQVNMPPPQVQVFHVPPYSVVDVLGQEVCALNSCKQKVYCFSGGATLQAGFNANAIMDFAGNYVVSGASQTVAIGDKVSIGNSPTTIIRTVPVDLAARVDTKAPLEVWFSSLVAKSTLGPKAVTLNHPEVNSWSSAFDTPDTAATTDDTRTLQPKATKVVVGHDPFKTKTIYYATVAAGVQDLLQNCIAPQ